MADKNKNRGNYFWNDILGGSKILNDTDVNLMETIVKKIRKDYGFRK